MNFINYLEGDNKDARYWGKKVIEVGALNGYRYERHILPHDAGNRSSNDSFSYIDHLNDTPINIRGDNIFRLERPKSKINAINVARDIFEICSFDENNCADGVDCLTNYRKVFNKTTYIYDGGKPFHDWASNGADAFLYSCEWVRLLLEQGVLPATLNKKRSVKTDIDTMLEIDKMNNEETDIGTYY